MKSQHATGRSPR